MLSVRLDRFTVKKQSPYKANFRCPICGDSETSKTKARGWLVETNSVLLFHCFNCGVSKSFGRFLKAIDPVLYDEYLVEVKLGKFAGKSVPASPPIALDKLTTAAPKFTKAGSPLLKIKKVSQLRHDHPVRQYVDKRKIPTNQHHRLYYAPKFNSFVNELIPGKMDTKFEEPRLVLPLIDVDKTVFGFQGRAFNPKSLRYITIMLAPSKPKIFGADYVDWRKRYFVLEGPIDSLFLSNAIAMAGADVGSSALLMPENAVFVFDNEPRNADIVHRMGVLMERGHKVCIWPNRIKQKDVNDMVLAGLSATYIEQTINDNVFSGLMGKLQLAEWKKC